MHGFYLAFKTGRLLISSDWGVSDGFLCTQICGLRESAVKDRLTPETLSAANSLTLISCTTNFELTYTIVDRVIGVNKWRKNDENVKLSITGRLSMEVISSIDITP
jgi:hypothetical protein